MPRPVVEDVLKIPRRIELLIVIDAEVPFGLLQQNPSHAWRRVDRVGVRHHDERTEATVLDQIDAPGEPVNVRMIPRHRERDRCVEQDAEVVPVVGPLVEVPEIDGHPASHALLNAQLHGRDLPVLKQRAARMRAAIPLCLASDTQGSSHKMCEYRLDEEAAVNLLRVATVRLRRCIEGMNGMHVDHRER
jgi:hypothetical protein